MTSHQLGCHLVQPNACTRPAYVCVCVCVCVCKMDRSCQPGLISTPTWTVNAQPRTAFTHTHTDRHTHNVTDIILHTQYKASRSLIHSAVYLEATADGKRGRQRRGKKNIEKGGNKEWKRVFYKTLSWCNTGLSLQIRYRRRSRRRDWEEEEEEERKIIGGVGGIYMDIK